MRNTSNRKATTMRTIPVPNRKTRTLSERIFMCLGINACLFLLFVCGAVIANANASTRINFDATTPGYVECFNKSTGIIETIPVRDCSSR